MYNFQKFHKCFLFLFGWHMHIVGIQVTSICVCMHFLKFAIFFRRECSKLDVVLIDINSVDIGIKTDDCQFYVSM